MKYKVCRELQGKLNDLGYNEIEIMKIETDVFCVASKIKDSKNRFVLRPEIIGYVLGMISSDNSILPKNKVERDDKIYYY